MSMSGILTGELKCLLVVVGTEEARLGWVLEAGSSDVCSSSSS